MSSDGHELGQLSGMGHSNTPFGNDDVVNSHQQINELHTVPRYMLMFIKRAILWLSFKLRGKLPGRASSSHKPGIAPIV